MSVPLDDATERQWRHGLRNELNVITMAVSFPLLVGFLGSETERTFAGILQFLAH